MKRTSRIVATVTAVLLTLGLSATAAQAASSNTAGGAVGCCRWLF